MREPMAGAPEIRCVRVLIAGRVQGVSYRAWTKRRAEAHGLSGWVRNLVNGDVEATFSGPAESVGTMLAECREGPRLARVTKVEVVEAAQPVTGPFTIRHDR
jgi:acylphosphatase